MMSTPSKKKYKPINLYAVAAGYYPIIPSSGMQNDRAGFSIIKHYSKDYRSQGNRPAMWKENGTPITAYVQGNHIFSTRHRNVQRFSSGESTFLARNKSKFINMRNQLAGRARGINLEMAKSMNVKLGGNYRKATASTLQVPASVGETFATPAGGKTIGYTKPIDTDLEGRKVNITASALGEAGHGQYGSGQRRLKEVILSIENSKEKKKVKDKQKAEAGLKYFKERIPQWNAHIRYVKKKAGLDKVTTRATSMEKTKMAQAFKKQGAVQGMNLMAFGLQIQGKSVFETGGHMYEGSKQMTSQHLGNPDLMYTGPGAFESMPIDDYTFASFGPFRLKQQGADRFTYYTDIKSRIFRGYDMTMLFGNTMRSFATAQRGMTDKMVSFLTATHAGPNKTAARINATNRVTHKDIDTAVSLRPEVNLVQAGNAYNAAIDGMLKRLRKASRGVPQGIRAILTKNRFKFARQGAEYTSIWAAPYISIFDVKSLGAGYDPK